MTDTDPGTPDIVADPTPDGKSNESPDLTEEKTVAGLSRRIESLKKENLSFKEQLAKFTAQPDQGDEKLQKRLEALERDVKLKDIALKYADVAPFLTKAFEKGLDPSLVDEEFVQGIRELQANDEGEETPHNTLRRTPSQDEQEKTLLKSIPSLF